jgi:hypothetical protein
MHLDHRPVSDLTSQQRMVHRRSKDLHDNLVRDELFSSNACPDKSPKVCEFGRFLAEYDNLGFNPDTKLWTIILWDFL